MSQKPHDDRVSRTEQWRKLRRHLETLRPWIYAFREQQEAFKGALKKLYGLEDLAPGDNAAIDRLALAWDELSKDLDTLHALYHSAPAYVSKHSTFAPAVPDPVRLEQGPATDSAPTAPPLASAPAPTAPPEIVHGAPASRAGMRPTRGQCDPIEKRLRALDWLSNEDFVSRVEHDWDLCYGSLSLIRRFRKMIDKIEALEEELSEHSTLD